MKNIFILSFLFLSLNSYTQTINLDTVALDPEVILSANNSKFFQYRISFSQISSTWTSKSIEPEMTELFKTKASFNENLRQYVFVSSEDVDRILLNRTFINYEVTYFKKIPLLENN